MGRLVICFFILLWSGTAPAWAQTDSLSGRALREVKIFGRPATYYAAGSRVMMIDSTFLQVNKAASLADALQFRMPVYIKSYGQNMLATSAFRGTSASHTAVLWHGLNINLPTLGQTDFSLIPVNNFEQVEVQSGSASATYGTGAIGGAILLSAPALTFKGLKLHLQQDLGSFGYRYTSLGGSYGNRKISLRTNIYQNQTQNNFTFVNTTKSPRLTEKQENAAVSQKGFTQDIDLPVNNRNQILLRTWYTLSDNESQPNLVAANTHARIKHENLRLLTAWNYNAGLGKTTVKAAFFRDLMHFRDDNISSEALINTYQVQAEQNFIIKEKLNLIMGGEAQHFAGEVSGYARRVTENRGAIFSWLRYNPWRQLQISANVRQGFTSGFNPPLTPTAGFNFFVVKQTNRTLAFKANASRGYRVPTLNDRYWPTGNLNLKPEISWNYESGLHYTLKTKQLRLTSEATLYRLAVDNWIQWIPGSSGQWHPQNLKKVVSKGLELSTEATYQFAFLKISAGGTYGFTHTQQQKSYLVSGEPLNQQLSYVPRHLATTYNNIYYKTWFITANLNYTGYRYTTPENDRWLPTFTLLNLAAGKSFTWRSYRLEVIGKINNATNQVYQTMEYYAMPLRHYALSVRVHFNAAY